MPPSENVNRFSLIFSKILKANLDCVASTLALQYILILQEVLFAELLSDQHLLLLGSSNQLLLIYNYF